MLGGPLYIASTGLTLCPPVSVADAVGLGHYDAQEAERTQQLAATVASDDQRSPDLAVTAARQALERSPHTTEDIGVLHNAVLHHAGVDVWNSASYIQRELGILHDRCLGNEVRCGCAAGLVGVELAAAQLRNRDEPAALITTGDCWRMPHVDRWDLGGGVLGDGGTALVLSRHGGFAELRAICSTSDPTLEGAERGDAPFGPCAPGTGHPLPLRRRNQEFHRTMPKAEIWSRIHRGIRTAVAKATDRADVALDDIEHVVYSFIGRSLLQRELLDPLRLSIDRTTWQFGRSIGHLGPGDPIAGLHHLAESGRLTPGRHSLLIAAGGGMVWTVAVIRAISRPAWAATRP